MQKLTLQEEEAMLYIWELGDCCVKDVVKKYPVPQPPYTTIASVVKNLEKKGYLEGRLVGNTFLYAPIVKENEYKRQFMTQVVRNYFENSYKEMVTFCARSRKISADELKDIIDLIEQGKKG
ncbi:MAG: BlaI/MecI/CopY family transcriptional regulator [Prevotellaceae bacterium]|jgi:predicted transcriptional regulator|nr:BlaI/MecI/CopY family transcriptional regulator [Prevotellaceae bacterium]